MKKSAKVYSAWARAECAGKCASLKDGINSHPTTSHVPTGGAPWSIGHQPCITIATHNRMVENKTKPTKLSVAKYLRAIPAAQMRRDCEFLAKLMAQASGCPPVMWGSSMVGFGSYDYKYASGHAGNYFIIGLSPRKQNLTIYIMPGFERFASLMEKLGPHKTGKCCLYVKRLADLHQPTLRQLIQQSVRQMVCESN